MATQASGEGALIEPKDGLSYVRGSTAIPLSDATVGRFLCDTARRFADRPAVVFREQGIRWTWQVFLQEVDVLATYEGKSVLVRQGHLLASAFHPELTSDTIVHRYFLRMAGG